MPRDNQLINEADPVLTQRQFFDQFNHKAREDKKQRQKALEKLGIYSDAFEEPGSDEFIVRDEQ